MGDHIIFNSVYKLSISLLLFFGLSSVALGQNYVPGEVIIKLKSGGSGVGKSKASSAFAFVGKAVTQKNMSLKRSWTRMNMYHFGLKPGQKVKDAIEELKNDPDVEYVEPNYLVNKANVAGQSSEKFSASEVRALAGSYLATGAQIQAVESWTGLSTGSTKPIVAVIDTGVDTTHDVFEDSQAIWTNTNEIPGNGIDDDGNGFIDDVNGWNFVSNSGNMFDDDNHGTHVAGIILGVTQDIYTTPLATSKIQIMPLKFLDGQGIGKTSDAIQAIYYAVNNGATVINNSWGGPSYSSALHEAVVFTYDKGVSFVAAAGNSGTDNDSAPMYPASYNVPNVVAVAATDDSDYLASFSNFGIGTVHLGSPGVFILSTVPGESFQSYSGTSMASPFVAGVAALMKLESPNMLGFQMKSILLDTVDGVSQLSQKVSTEGRLNVLSAVQSAQGATVDGDQPAYQLTNGDRELASTLATGGGCGLVKSIYSDFNSRGPGSSSGGSSLLETWYIFVIIGLISLPLVIISIMRQREPKSRRVHDRFNIDTQVRVKSGDKELVGNISSISLGGVQLNTSELLEQGGIVKMSILSPDGQEHVQVEGRVVWSENKKAYGVQFAETRNTVLDRINIWTKNLVKMN